MKFPKWPHLFPGNPGRRPAAPAAPRADGPQSPGGGAPVIDELTANQARFPFPRWALDGTAARKWILDGIARGGVGAEIGVFRGHFSEVLLDTLAPRKFYMVDPWTTLGELFPWATEYSNHGALPTALARREAQLRAAKFPQSETVIVEGIFPDCIAQLDERLDWIYIDSSHSYQDTLRELKAAATILKPDGVIIGDDFYPDRTSYHHGVFRAVNEYVKISPFELVAAGPNAQWRLRRADVGSVARKGQKSINDELADIDARFPLPSREADENSARRAVLEFATARSCGAEVGAFRGRFSEIILDQLRPIKFFMIESWKEAGATTRFAGKSADAGAVPANVARREAELRAARFPNTETLLIDGSLRDLEAGVNSACLDWIYLHFAGDFTQMISDLVVAAGLLKPGGVIMGEGYYPGSARFQNDGYRAINEFVSATRFDCMSLNDAGQWCLQRKLTDKPAPPAS